MKRLLGLLLLLCPALAQAVCPDTTSYMTKVAVINSSTGAPLTGLAFNAAGLTCYYHRSSAASATSITLADGTVGTWSSGGWKQIDATNAPGEYQIGIPNAALVAGATDVTVTCKGATSMLQVDLFIPLDYASQDCIYADGTAQAGAAGSITLSASASAVNDFYLAQDGKANTEALIVAGTGAYQHRCITDYVGATKVATVSPNWVTTPDSTSKYVLLASPDCVTAIAVINGTLTSSGGSSAYRLW